MNQKKIDETDNTLARMFDTERNIFEKSIFAHLHFIFEPLYDGPERGSNVS